MNTIIADTGTVRMPALVTDLVAFRAWVHSDALPEESRACYLQGEVWVDMSKEQLFSHNQVKNELNIVLGGLAKSTGEGRYLPDGMLLTNVAADLSCQPDGVYISNESITGRRITFVEGTQRGIVELEGSPDLVIEIVSESSVEKDTQRLPDLYYRAGIDEYWLIDARTESLRYQILTRGPEKFEPVERQEGWLASNVFNARFSLECIEDSLGHPDYSLHHQAR